MVCGRRGICWGYIEGLRLFLRVLVGGSFARSLWRCLGLGSSGFWIYPISHHLINDPSETADPRCTRHVREFSISVSCAFTPVKVRSKGENPSSY